MALILLIAPKPRNKSRLKDQIALHKILAKRTVVSGIFSETDTCPFAEIYVIYYKIFLRMVPSYALFVTFSRQNFLQPTPRKLDANHLIN